MTAAVTVGLGSMVMDNYIKGLKTLYLTCDCHKFTIGLKMELEKSLQKLQIVL